MAGGLKFATISMHRLPKVLRDEVLDYVAGGARHWKSQYRPALEDLARPTTRCPMPFNAATDAHTPTGLDIGTQFVPGTNMFVRVILQGDSGDVVAVYPTKRFTRNVFRAFVGRARAKGWFVPNPFFYT